ncbi:hypothetical protein D0B54_04105 [Solimonas sp. K1W22B-7]|nr:hypothetical protein D0B54_04105 [Solimonas sp. K1W22B-7]
MLDAVVGCVTDEGVGAQQADVVRHLGGARGFRGGFGGFRGLGHRFGGRYRLGHGGVGRHGLCLGGQFRGGGGFGRRGFGGGRFRRGGLGGCGFGGGSSFGGDRFADDRFFGRGGLGGRVLCERHRRERETGQGELLQQRFHRDSPDGWGGHIPCLRSG